MLEGKPKVAILGATGMIGSSLYNSFKDKYELMLFARSSEKLALLNRRYGGVNWHRTYQLDLKYAFQEYLQNASKKLLSPTLEKLSETLNSADWIVNALGIIKPYCDSDPALAYFVNSTFPQILGEIFGNKIIHITTDCVFNGSYGAPYDENSPKLPPDIYGLTKMLGDTTKTITLRTSTVGPELFGDRGLLMWLMSKSGQKVNGYINHLWNGITSQELGNVCQKIINREVLVSPGIYHIFSDDITKYDLLVKFNQRFNLGCEINPVEAPIAIDRRLRTVKDLNHELQIPSLDDQIANLQL
jgi:dTDP-4-dehydrorhamnose reductase